MWFEGCNGELGRQTLKYCGKIFCIHVSSADLAWAMKLWGMGRLWREGVSVNVSRSAMEKNTGLREVGDPRGGWEGWRLKLEGCCLVLQTAVSVDKLGKQATRS